MNCPNIRYTKTEILERVREGGANLKDLIDKLVEELSQCDSFLRAVVSYVLKNGGNAQDAEDILQEGLAQLVINLSENKYKGNSSIENYACGICKLMWNNRFRKESRFQYPDPTYWIHNDKETANPKIKEEFSKEQKMIWSIIGHMNKECKELFKLVYFEFSYKEIGIQLNIAEQTVKNKVSGCRKKLRAYLNQHPILKSYFTI